jgi:hypothetical protein
MRTLGGFCLALFLSVAMFAQQRGFGSVQPVIQGSFGNVVFPGGTSAIPGVQRTLPGIVVSGPRLNVPFSNQDPTRLSSQGILPRPGYSFVGNPRRSRGAAVVAVPVYVGGGYGSYYDNSYPPDQAAPPQPGSQQPNIIVIYPPAPQPVVLGGSSEGLAAAPQALSTRPAEDATAQSEAPHYLIAFKDHSIYSAVAYWVQGDTLHYFTSGNTHNQASLSLVDRDLTERLNRESGFTVQLPK